MLLSELRALLREQEQSSYNYWRSFIFKEQDGVVKVRQFLEQYKNKSDDYILTGDDVFILFTTIPLNSKLELINSIKSHFYQNYLWMIYETLSDAGLIDEKNFTTIYNFSYAPRYLLYTLFCAPSGTIRLTPETFETALAMAKHSYAWNKEIIQVFKFLNSTDCLTKQWLDLLAKRGDGINHLFNILQEFNKVNFLDEDCASKLLMAESYHILDKLLEQLKSINISLNKELCTLLCKSGNTAKLSLLLEPLISAKIALNTQIITMLLQKDYLFFKERIPLCNLLQKHELLDDKIFNKICQHNVCLVENILTTLSAANLLAGNKQLVKLVVGNKLPRIDFNKGISYLKEKDLLDKSTLDLCINKSMEPHLSYDSGKGIFDILDLLKAKFTIPKEKLPFLFNLSSSDCQRLYWMLFYLIQANLLDIQSFEQAVVRTSQKLPPITEAIFTRSPMLANTQYTEINLDNNKHFFIKSHEHHNSYRSVQQGFFSVNGDDGPRYAIKKLPDFTSPTVKKQAAHEVKYSHLLKREAFYYATERVYVATEWQQGKPLKDFSADELKQQPLLKRIHCLISGLTELDTLHRNSRVHGNVTCKNFILDLSLSSMKLINFTTSHLNGHPKVFMQKLAYHEPSTPFNHRCGKDLYAMGIVAMYLFPEIYSLIFSKKKIDVTVSKSELTMQQQAIIRLIDAMMHLDNKIRCSSEDALSYCKEITANFDTLDPHAVEKIATTTINRTDINVEDVLRDMPKMYKFNFV